MVKGCPDNQQCEAMIQRVIQPLVAPLVQKIDMLKAMNAKEGRKLRKGEINDATLTQIQGYLYLIGHFLKQCHDLSTRHVNPYAKLFEEIWVFISDIIQEFMNLDEIVEFSIKIMKQSLRILERNFDKYLIPFL